jgi:hypothetical protein
MGFEPRLLAHAHPGELARAVHNCLECLDRAECEELPAQDRRVAHAPRHCSNRDWISKWSGERRA